jgi:hypothetical protein
MATQRLSSHHDARMLKRKTFKLLFTIVCVYFCVALTVLPTNLGEYSIICNYRAYRRLTDVTVKIFSYSNLYYVALSGRFSPRAVREQIFVREMFRAEIDGNS